MRIVHRYIMSDESPDQIQKIIKILDIEGLTYSYAEDLKCVIPSFKYSIEFYLYEDHLSFSKIKPQINTITKEQIIGTEYEKEDYRRADWFVVSTGNFGFPQPEDNYNKLTFDNSNHCKYCGIGKVQNNPFRLKKIKEKQNLLWGINWEFDSIFVSPEIRSLIEEEDMKGISFSNVLKSKGDNIAEGTYQMQIEQILHQGFSNYNTKTITCKLNNEENCNKDESVSYCGRVKYHHPMIGGYLFDKSIFNQELSLVK